MAIYDLLKKTVLTAAVVGMSGCNSVEQSVQPMKPQQPVNLEERVEKAPKITSVTKKIKKQISERPDFFLQNYENVRKYGGFDIEPVNAPDFVAELQNGKMVSSQELAKKHDYVLLYFASDDCPICWDIEPIMKEFYSKNKKYLELVSLVGVVKEEEWDAYKIKKKADYPFAKDMDDKVSNKYGTEVVPSFVLTQSVSENGRKRLKAISVSIGGGWGSQGWLEDLETAVTWAQWMKGWNKDLAEKKAQEK